MELCNELDVQSCNCAVHLASSALLTVSVCSKCNCLLAVHLLWLLVALRLTVPVTLSAHCQLGFVHSFFSARVLLIVLASLEKSCL